MFVLKIGKNPCEWTEINDFNGIPSCERYFHSMNYYEKENFLFMEEEMIILKGAKIML